MGKKKKNLIPEATTILENLLLGSRMDLLNNENFIKEKNIKFILCCAEECSHEEMKISKDVNVKILCIKDETDKLESKDFEESVKFIDQMKDDEVTFVHCMRGRSRSASVVISYLMFKNKMNLKDAYCHVKSKRPFIGPHGRLRSQLIDLEKQWFGKSSLTLEELEDIHHNWKKSKSKQLQMEEQIIIKEEQESLNQKSVL
jgi:dual specificity phosphatase 12